MHNIFYLLLQKQRYSNTQRKNNAPLTHGFNNAEREIDKKSMNIYSILDVQSSIKENKVEKSR